MTAGFPLLRSLKEAYGEVGARPGFMLRLGVGWLFLALLPRALTPWLLATVAGPPAIADPGLVALLVLAADLTAKLVWLLGISAVAVAWQRRVLLDEQPAAWLAPVNRRVLRYLLLSLLLALVITLISMLLHTVLSMLAAGPDGAAAGPVPEFGLRLVVGLSAAIVLARLHLVLPAAAIDDDAMSSERSVTLTGGHTWPLCLGLIATIIPLPLLGSLVRGQLDPADAAAGLVGLALATVADFLQASVLATFLAVSYRFFVRPPPAMSPALTRS